jgi:hypothetical protein
MADGAREFISAKLEKALSELRATEETARALVQRLGKAEEALRFYANPKNYAVILNSEGSAVFQDRLIGDLEDAANTSQTKIAGARARQYLKIYGDVPVTRL